MLVDNLICERRSTPPLPRIERNAARRRESSRPCCRRLRGRTTGTWAPGWRTKSSENRRLCFVGWSSMLLLSLSVVAVVAVVVVLAGCQSVCLSLSRPSGRLSAQTSTRSLVFRLGGKRMVRWLMRGELRSVRTMTCLRLPPPPFVVLACGLWFCSWNHGSFCTLLHLFLCLSGCGVRCLSPPFFVVVLPSSRLTCQD